jgi:membrane-bound serine protease (ClpP class)
VSALGVILVLLAVALVLAEAHAPSHGVLATGGAAALTAGVVLALVGGGVSGGVVVAAGLAVAAAASALVWPLLVKSLAARRLTVRSGPGTLVGRVATVRTVPTPVGRVQLDGALWRARLSSLWQLERDGTLPAEGSPVVVESVDGLTLTVRPAESWEVDLP